MTLVGGRAHPREAVGALALGDFGDPGCGVGSSMAAFAARAGAVVVLDPTTGWRRYVSEARAAARRGLRCTAVYPTRSTVYRRSLPLRFLVLVAAFGRARVGLHLHEYRRLRRMLRWPATALLPLAHRIVVSSAGEAAAVEAAWRGRVGRWCEVVVAPPANGTPAPAGPVRRPPRSTGTVGVFGMRRDDKSVGWLGTVLGGLAPAFDRLELVGAGWDGLVWSPAITDRFTVVALGHVDEARLSEVFSSWDLALAPFEWPAHDGRMSLRTPLAFGVPTVTVGPPDDDLTLRPRHLAFSPPADVETAVGAVVAADVQDGAEEVARFEDECARRLARALFGGSPR